VPGDEKNSRREGAAAPLLLMPMSVTVSGCSITVATIQ